MLNAKLPFVLCSARCLPVMDKCSAFLFLHSISASLHFFFFIIFFKLQQASRKEVTDLQITERFLKTISKISPLAINSVYNEEFTFPEVLMGLKIAQKGCEMCFPQFWLFSSWSLRSHSTHSSYQAFPKGPLGSCSSQTSLEQETLFTLMS